MRLMIMFSLATLLGCPSPSGDGGQDAGSDRDGAAADANAAGGDGAMGAPCSQLDQAECDASPMCQSALGAPAEEVCAGDYSNWATVWSGCVDATLGCDDAETCASDPSTGTRLYFPDSCVPDGWLACDCQVPSSCQQGGSPEALGRLCVRGELGADGESIAVDSRVRIQASPHGCFGSGCVLTYDNVCAATVNGSDIALDSLFCIGPSGEKVCKPDCSGAGFALCDTDVLSAGTYTVSANGLSVTFTVPSQVPFGGVCDELPL